MKRVLIASIAILCIVSGVKDVVLADQPDADAHDIVITEVQPGSTTNSRQEFIEIINRSDRIIDFGAEPWSVQIASSSAKDWSSPIRTIKLVGYLYPQTQYLIGTTYSSSADGVTTTNHYPEEADAYYAAALSASTGHVRVVKTEADEINKTVQDEIEWGSDNNSSIDHRTVFITSKAISPGTSIERRIAAGNDYMMTGIVMDDYALNSTPTPFTNTAEQPDLPAIPEPEPSEDVVEVDQPVTKYPLAITELLPNPAPPFIDAEDEFIEIYNSGIESVNLKGMSLETGATTMRSYVFRADTWIDPMAYQAFYSRDTKLVLSNTSSRARLLSAEGGVIAETPLYATAQNGSAWQYLNGEWQWSASPTPGALNQYVLPIAAATKTNVSKAPVAKKTTSKVATPAKAKAVKKAKAAKPKTTKTKVIKATPTAFVAEAAAKPPAIHTGILAAVLGVALLYGAYEYRYELARYFKKLGTNRNAGRGHRPELEGRRNATTDK